MKPGLVFNGAAAAAVLLSSLSATAQYRSSVPGYGNFSRMRQHFSDRAVRRSTNPSGPARRDRQTPVPATGATSFRPVAAELAPALMASQGNHNPERRAEDQKGFSEMLALYRKRLRESGGAQNDFARAAAWMAANSYQIYFGGKVIPQAQFDALRRQFEAEFGSSPAFQRKTSRERQIEFEVYAILGMAVLLQDETQRRRLKTLARENLLALYDAPPERLALSDSGVRIR